MIDFLKYKHYSIAFFFIILATFIGALIYNVNYRGSAFNYSVDFTGGTQVLLGFSKPVTSKDITQSLEKEYQGINIREFSPKEFIIRIKKSESDVKELSQNIVQTLHKSLPNIDIKVNQVDSVSSSMGQTLRTKSLYAIILSIIFMLAYIALRFRSFGFATGAVGALFNDTLVILTYFLLLYKEIDISVIVAVLVILGYSVNDTIVIFSYIRKNMIQRPKESLNKIINISINETLSRTIKTSITTSVVILSLLVFGGSGLRSLSISLLIGIIFGTYSSIYMASPIMLEFNKYRNKKYAN